MDFKDFSSRRSDVEEIDLKFPRIREHYPPFRPEHPAQDEVVVPRRRRGRPKGSRTAPRSVSVRQEVVLGVRYADHREIPPALWNLLVSLLLTVFRGLLKVAKKLRVEAPGHEQEQILFEELPSLLFDVIRELAEWWWSFDCGFLGTTLTCPKCGADIKCKGGSTKGIVTPFGEIHPLRAYYVCSNKACTVPCKTKPSRRVRFSLCPLDQRLGLDREHFLPCVQEVVVWLTSLDPYGKCLQFISKLLHFSICHRSAWKITLKIGALAKEREDEAIAQAFADPRAVVLPKAEVAPPKVGVFMFDGTCGRVDNDDDGTPEEAEEENPDAPPRPPKFREIKLALAAHLVPSVTAPTVAATSPTGQRKKKHRKVRPQGEGPSLGHKKLAVQLGTPLRLFQMAFLLFHRLALDKAEAILAIGDGAHWIWKGVREHLSSLGVVVVEVLDYWHAVQHVWHLANALFGQGTAETTAWVKQREAELLGGRLSDFFNVIEEAVKNAKNVSKDLEALAQKQLNYFRNNECRMDYARYLASGYLIGSGAMEGSCKNHVNERVDRGGMHWSATGVMAVLRNRTLIKNGEWDAFWKTLAESRQARYQSLKSRLAL